MNASCQCEERNATKHQTISAWNCGLLRRGRHRAHSPDSWPGNRPGKRYEDLLIFLTLASVASIDIASFAGSPSTAARWPPSGPATGGAERIVPGG